MNGLISCFQCLIYLLRSPHSIRNLQSSPLHSLISQAIQLISSAAPITGLEVCSAVVIAITMPSHFCAPGQCRQPMTTLSSLHGCCMIAKSGMSLAFKARMYWIVMRPGDIISAT